MLVPATAASLFTFTCVFRNNKKGVYTVSTI
jgi:hypothetical protein